MASETILEREMAQIKRLLRSKPGSAEPWWKRIAGVFEDARVFRASDGARTPVPRIAAPERPYEL
jgi:hypothetical protein